MANECDWFVCKLLLHLHWLSMRMGYIGIGDGHTHASPFNMHTNQMANIKHLMVTIKKTTTTTIRVDMNVVVVVHFHQVRLRFFNAWLLYAFTHHDFESLSVIHSLTKHISFRLYFKAHAFCDEKKKISFYSAYFPLFPWYRWNYGWKRNVMFWIHASNQSHTYKNIYENASQINVLKMNSGCDVVSDLLDLLNINFVVWSISHPLQITLNNVYLEASTNFSLLFIYLYQFFFLLRT